MIRRNATKNTSPPATTQIGHGDGSNGHDGLSISSTESHLESHHSLTTSTNTTTTVFIIIIGLLLRHLVKRRTTTAEGQLAEERERNGWGRRERNKNIITAATDTNPSANCYFSSTKRCLFGQDLRPPVEIFPFFPSLDDRPRWPKMTMMRSTGGVRGFVLEKSLLNEAETFRPTPATANRGKEKEISKYQYCMFFPRCVCVRAFVSRLFAATPAIFPLSCQVDPVPSICRISTHTHIHTRVSIYINLYIA